jgi:deoxyribonuclease-4
MSASGGLDKAVRKGKAIGCTAIQVFTSSPQQWHSKEVSDDMAAEFRAALEETGIGSITSHDSYLINLCAQDSAKRLQSIQGMIGEVRRCAKYGIPNVVSHMGAHMGSGTEWGLDGIAESVKEVLEETPDTVTVLMETTAGQGSALMSRFEELAGVLDRLHRPRRLAICMDTCHIFVAGYDIRTAEAFAATMEEFDKLLGADLLRAVHCNDSKKPLGSRADRHAHIGDGEIGLEAFRYLMNDKRFEHIPILLETDAADDGHERDLATLKSLVGQVKSRG